ncbi:hypothetical protein MMPV_006315 [Pyropia vietnamensis]
MADTSSAAAGGGAAAPAAAAAAPGGRPRELRLTYTLRAAEAVHRSGVTSLARSSADGGGTLFTGGRDGTVRRWAVPVTATEVGVATGWAGFGGGARGGGGGVTVSPASAVIPAATATFDEHVDWVNDLAVLRYAGADRVASASSDGTVKVWHPDTGVAVRTLAAHSDYVMALALPSATSVASASLDGRVLVWDVECGRVASDLTGGRTKPGASLYCLAGIADGPPRGAPGSGGGDGGGGGWSPAADAGRVLVAGSRDRLVTVWDARAGTRVASLRGHTDTVRAVAVAAGGATLLSGSADTSVRVWDLRMQRVVTAVEAHADSVWALAVGGGGVGAIRRARRSRVADSACVGRVAVCVAGGGGN